LSQPTDQEVRTNRTIVLSVLALLAVIVAYFVYRAVERGLPSCEPAFKSCMQRCEGTTGDNAAAQACQRACEVTRKSCQHELVVPGSLHGEPRSDS
jgi:hypothetical protein